MPLFLFEFTDWDDWRRWLDHHALRLLVVVVILLVAEIAFRKFIGRLLSRAITRAASARFEDHLAIRRRADTLSATLNWAFGVVLGFLGLGLVLSEVGLNVSALIAGVGVVGIALGLGAQTLVKDVINGMFILIEDQYAVGDTVTVAGATGVVLEINPRRTVIRDDVGNIHSIPNSAIVVATNRTAGLRRYTVFITVSFRDSEVAAKLANEVSTVLAEDIRDDVRGAPRITSQAVTGDNDVRIALAGEAEPAARWKVESELRRRLKRTFEAERIDVSFESAEVGANPD